MDKEKKMSLTEGTRRVKIESKDENTRKLKNQCVDCLHKIFNAGDSQRIKQIAEILGIK